MSRVGRLLWRVQIAFRGTRLFTGGNPLPGVPLGVARLHSRVRVEAV
jgi:hypothetical protein